MAQYTTGTVTVTNGSATVTGSDTIWSSAGIAAGAIFTVADSNVWYEIATVDSDTQITLASNYAGVTDSGLSYAVTVDFTPRLGLPLPYKGNIETASIIRRALMEIDNNDIFNGVIDGGTF